MSIIYKNRTRSKDNVNNNFVNALDSGISSINGSSVSAQNLQINKPVKTNNEKVLISSLISQSDLDFTPVAYTGTIPAPVGNFTKISSVNGNIEDSVITETDITTLQTDITDLQNDKLSIDGTILMTGPLQLGGNNITGVLNITASNVYSNINTLSISGLLNQDIGINNNTRYNNNNIENVNNLQTNEIRATGNSVNIKDDVNMGFYDIININEIKTNNIATNTLTDVNFISPINMNNNNITNVNNLQTQEIKATDGVSINIQDDVNMGLYDINNCNEIKTNGISTNTLTDVIFISPINMNNNNITNVNEIKTDFIASSTNTDVKMNSDLNLNGKNIIGLDLINGIQPSGGLYSESSGFQVLSANTIETNLLAQGANSGSLTIPPNVFLPLNMYSFKASGTLSGGTNDIFTLRAKSLTDIPSSVPLGEIVVEIADNGLVNVWWDIQLDFTVRTSGIAGIAVLVLSGVFRYTNTNDVVRTYGRNIIINTGFDTTIQNTLELTYQNDATNPLTNFTINQGSFTKWY